LALKESILGIGTECYGPVKPEIVNLDSANNTFNRDLHDHIIEGGLNLNLVFCRLWTVLISIVN